MKALIASLCLLLAVPCLAQVFPDGEPISRLETRLKKLERKSSNTGTDKPIVEKPEPKPEPRVDPRNDEETKRAAIEVSFDEYMDSVKDEVKRVLYESEEIKGYSKKVDKRLQDYFWARLTGASGLYREAAKRLKGMDVYSGSVKDDDGEKKRVLREIQSGSSWLMYYQSEVLDDIDFDAKSRSIFERGVKRAIESHQTKGLAALDDMAKNDPYSDKWNIDQTRRRPDEFEAWLTKLSSACFELYDAQQEMIDAPHDIEKVKDFLLLQTLHSNIVPRPILSRQLTYFYIENFPEDELVKNGYALLTLASNYQSTFEFEKALEVAEESFEYSGRGPKQNKMLLEIGRAQRKFEEGYLDE